MKELSVLIHPYFHFWTITLVNVNKFSPILMGASSRSGLGLMIGRFSPFMTVICTPHPPIQLYFLLRKCQSILTKLGWCFGLVYDQISSIYDRFICPNLFSKCQSIFTKLSGCIDIIKIWFGIVNGQISSIYDRIYDNPFFFFFFFYFYFTCPHPSVFSFPDDNFCKY